MNMRGNLYKGENYNINMKNWNNRPLNFPLKNCTYMNKIFEFVIKFRAKFLDKSLKERLSL